MKKRLALLLLAVCLLGAAACSGGERELTEAALLALNEEETYEEDRLFCYADIFASVSELYDASELIVECSVDTAETLTLEGHPEKYSTVTVNTVLRGEAEEGGALVVLEGPSPVPKLEEGQHLILFLNECDSAWYDELYCISGGQGKFIEREGYYFQQAHHTVKLPLEEYYPQTLSGFTGLLDQI
ncbi:MAG: hypothetical protein HFF18_06580 [Oscillospiraceae bacterium]|nr:hypothetical protein [Oscillospiraceae bacterium]